MAGSSRRSTSPFCSRWRRRARSEGSRSSAARSASRSRCSPVRSTRERVVELGSGFGYSAYWFSRAVGEGRAAPHRRRPRERAEGRGLPAPGRTWPGRSVITSATPWPRSRKLEGEFDVVYCDIDKEGYPDAWRAARDQIRRAACTSVTTCCGPGGSRSKTRTTPVPTRSGPRAQRAGRGGRTLPLDDRPDPRRRDGGADPDRAEGDDLRGRPTGGRRPGRR